MDPTTADLFAIEAEWPVISAEMDLVDAECRLAAWPFDVLAGRAYRRAVRRRLVALAAARVPVLASGIVPVAA